MCVPNFRSVSFFVWPVGSEKTNPQTHSQVKIDEFSTGFSPHVDFDKENWTWIGWLHLKKTCVPDGEDGGEISVDDFSH